MDDLETIVRRNEQMTDEQAKKVVACLRRAGLCMRYADRIIEAEDNALAKEIVALLYRSDPMRPRIQAEPPV